MVLSMKCFLFCRFIGIEVAAALVGKAKTVTLVGLVEAPFQEALGKEVGNAVRKVCQHAVFNLMIIVIMMYTHMQFI